VVAAVGGAACEGPLTDLLLWGLAATLKTAIHETGHVIFARAAGAAEARIVSIAPYHGRAHWRWASPPTLTQQLAAQGGGLALCRGLSELGGPWQGPLAPRLQWLLRLDPILYVLRSLAGEFRLLPPLAGDDVARILGRVADHVLANRIWPPEEYRRTRERVVRMLYGVALVVTATDVLLSWAGSWGPFGSFAWEVRF